MKRNGHTKLGSTFILALRSNKALSMVRSPITQEMMEHPDP